MLDTITQQAQAQRRPHPLDAMTGDTLDFDLMQEIARLHGEADWATGRNAKTLAKYDDLRIVLTTLAAGRRIPGHQTEGRISIQAVTGHLHVHVGARTFDLPAGQLLVVDRALPHDVEALEASAFLLTVAWPTGRK